MDFYLFPFCRMKPIIDSESVKLNKKSSPQKIKQKLFRQDGTNKSDIKVYMRMHSKKKRQKYIKSTVEDKTTESEQNTLSTSSLKVDSQSEESDRLRSKKKTRREKNKNVTKRLPEHPDSIMSSKDHCSVSSQNCLSLLITNLPKHINYSMLKDAIPSAARLHLFRKSGKRLAFANFYTMDDYSNAISRLEGLEFDGVKPLFRQVTRHEKTEKKKPESGELRLTIHNLPYSITVTELEDEFPTAKSIIINTKKTGVNKGSCLLEFECHDDLQVVLDACQNKVIGGRRVSALPGLHFEIKSENTKANTKEATTFGIKICKMSTSIEDDRLRQQFPLGSIIEYCSVPTSNPSCRNVFLTLRNNISNQLIVKKLRRKGIDQHRLRIQSWYKKDFKSQKIELKPPTDGNKNEIDEPKLKASGSAKNGEMTFSESDKKNKLKKQKLEKMDVSLENTKLVASDSANKKHKLKKRKYECVDVNMIDSHSSNTPQSHKKKEFKTKERNHIGDNPKHIVFDQGNKNEIDEPKLKASGSAKNGEMTFSESDKKNKLKKQKLEKMDVSLENTKLVASDSANKKHKLKKRKYECVDVNMIDSHSSNTPQSHKKKEFKTKERNHIGDNPKHIVFDQDG
ncbi:unnamed protein product [Schistosoma intercalatum]|nr:unnamed protein product [Schistosoma intercalatum]